MTICQASIPFSAQFGNRSFFFLTLHGRRPWLYLATLIMKITDTNKIANTQTAEQKAAETVEIKPQGFKELWEMVKSEEIVPLTNENDEIIGINGHVAATGAKASKVIGGHMTIGKDEEERQKDEANLKAFIEKFTGLFMVVGGPQKAMFAALCLVRADITPDYAFIDEGRLFFADITKQIVVDEDGNTIVKTELNERVGKAVIEELLLTKFAVDHKNADRI